MKSLFPDHIDLTARVMDFQIQHQNIVSGNLANINTPGYKARTLEFEKDLQAALGISQNGPVSRTHPKHLPAKFSPDATEASVVEEVQLVRALLVVAFGYFDRIARIHETYEIYALYHPSVFDVKARDYAFCESIQSSPSE